MVLIGPLNDTQYYYEARQAASGGGVKFIDTLKSKDLANAYAAAKVHALVSWYDIPGLVSLEAALAGCNLVTTVRGSASEYLGDMAYYCDPGDLDSIAQALLTAWQSPPNPGLSLHVANNFSWEKTAQATYQAYCAVIGLKA